MQPVNTPPPHHGLAIAKARIATEAKERTGFLDLGKLALTALPQELFALTHLHSLNLGFLYKDAEGKWHLVENDLGPDAVSSSLADLSKLNQLSSLFIAGLQDFHDLTPLAALEGLQTLDCSHTQVSSLAPLAALKGLQTLNCSYTQVSDLAPLAALEGLQTLHCSSTQVSDLTPLAALTGLQTLGCTSTKVSDLAPLAALEGLQTLYCSHTMISNVPLDFWNKANLQTVTAVNTTIVGLPPELLSQDWDDNCLARIRAHLADLSIGSEPMRDVKLMVLGNGRIGKTQLCRRLRAETYDKSVPSTHGVLVTSTSLPLAGQNNAKLHIWDFGGQDIYHGTHALFTRSRAIFAIIWTLTGETTREHEHNGVLYRNQPRAYWLDYVKQFGGAQSPALVVQTQCDDPRQEVAISQSDQDLLQTFSFKKTLHFSACGPRGLLSLQEALGEAAKWLWQEQGIAEIGIGRARVKRHLEKLRDEDAARQPSERQNRTLSYAAFEAICQADGGISAPEYLADFLHNCGTIFWRKGLFQNSLILDQAWALDAIYAVFHREKSLAKLKRFNGRFTLADLGDWIWNEAGHSIKEQQLFLDMMQSCGICFVHRRGDEQHDIETEYIAPDHLPVRSQIPLQRDWDEDIASETVTFDYPLLPETLMRNIISHIGDQAGLNAEYWQGGVFFYDAQTKSRAIIEHTKGESWQGSIRLSAQLGDAKTLLSKLIHLVTEEQSKLGLTPSNAPSTMSHHHETKDEQKLTIIAEPYEKPTWFVSYAWKDDTPEGAKREEIVDKLCAEAEAKGKIILRDKNVLALGDQISTFMRRIGKGERVFIVLSDKYLCSANCMFELYEVWRSSRLDDEEFIKRIRVFALDDATIWTPLDRAKWARHWRQQFEQLKEYFDDLGAADLQHYKLMKMFHSQIGEILSTVADTLQPRTFQELIDYGFKD